MLGIDSLFSLGVSSLTSTVSFSTAWIKGIKNCFLTMIICHNSDLIVKWNHKHIEEDQKNTSFPEAWLSIVKYEQLVFNAITGVEFCVVLSLSPYCTQLSYIFCAFFKLFRDHLMYTSLRVDRLISTKLHCQLTRLPPRPLNIHWMPSENWAANTAACYRSGQAKASPCLE